MADTIFYKRGNAYHDSSGNPAIIEKGNELTFTEHFNAGGGYELPIAGVNTLGGVKIGDGLNVTAGGVLSVTNPAYSTDEVNTGRKWVDGSPVYEKTFYFENGINIPTNGTDIEENAPVNLVLGAWCSDGIHGYAPIQASVENNILKAFAITGSLNNIKYVVFTYTKTTPAEPANTRTSKKKG